MFLFALFAPFTLGSLDESHAEERGRERDREEKQTDAHGRDS